MAIAIRYICCRLNELATVQSMPGSMLSCPHRFLEAGHRVRWYFFADNPFVMPLEQAQLIRALRPQTRILLFTRCD